MRNPVITIELSNSKYYFSITFNVLFILITFVNSILATFHIPRIFISQYKKYRTCSNFALLQNFQKFSLHKRAVINVRIIINLRNEINST